MLLERRSSDVSAISWKVHGTSVSWPNSSIGTQSCPTRPAVPPGASTRPARGISGFWIRQVGELLYPPADQRLVSLHLSSPKPGHTPGGSVRGGARRDGRAGRRRAPQSMTGQFALEKTNSLISRRWINDLLGVPLEAKTRKNLDKSVQSKTRTYHGRVASERPAERPEELEQDQVQKKLFAQKKKVHRSLQCIGETSLERLSRSTKKRNSM